MGPWSASCASETFLACRLREVGPLFLISDISDEAAVTLAGAGGGVVAVSGCAWCTSSVRGRGGANDLIRRTFKALPHSSGDETPDGEQLSLPDATRGEWQADGLTHNIIFLWLAYTLYQEANANNTTVLVLVSGIWYLVYCTSPIAYPIVNGYSPSGTWGPRTVPGPSILPRRLAVVQ